MGSPALNNEPYSTIILAWLWPITVKNSQLVHMTPTS